MMLLVEYATVLWLDAHASQLVGVRAERATEADQQITQQVTQGVILVLTHGRCGEKVVYILKQRNRSA